MPDEEDVADWYDLRPSGGIHLWVDGQRIKLRVPRLRDYRAMVELYYEKADEISDWNRENIEWATALMEKAEGREATDEERAEERARSVKLTGDIGLQWLGWIRACVERLGTEGQIPEEDDDLPVFLTQQPVATAWIQHWRTVPVPSGAR